MTQDLFKSLLDFLLCGREVINSIEFPLNFSEFKISGVEDFNVMQCLLEQYF